MGERAGSLVRALISGRRKRSSPSDFLDNDGKRFCSASPESKTRRPVSCPICHEILSQSSALQRHLDIIHFRGRKSYGCSICGKTFNRKDVRDRHIDKHTQANYVACSGCGNKYRKDYLGEHLKSDRNQACQAAYARNGGSSSPALTLPTVDRVSACEEPTLNEVVPEDLLTEPQTDSGRHALRQVLSSTTNTSKALGSESLNGPSSSTNTVATSQYDSPCRRSEDGLTSGTNQSDHNLSTEQTSSRASICSQLSRISASPVLVPNSPLLFGFPPVDEILFDLNAIPENEEELEVHKSQLCDLQKRACSNTGAGSSIEQQVRRRISKATRKTIRVPWPLPGEACRVCEWKFGNTVNKGKVLQHMKQHIVDVPEPRHICDSCGMAFVFKTDLRRHIKSKPSGLYSGCELAAEADDWSRIMREDITKDLRAWERYQICDLVYRLMQSDNVHQKAKSNFREAGIPRCSWPSRRPNSAGARSMAASSAQMTMSSPTRPPLTTLGSTRSQSSRHDSIVSCPYNIDYGTTYSVRNLENSFKKMSLYSEDGHTTNASRPRYHQGSSNCILHDKQQRQSYRKYSDICASCRKNGLWTESMMGHLHNVQTLLQASVDPSTCPEWAAHESPLAAAVRWNHIKIAELLIKHAPRLHKHASEADTFVQYFCQHVSADDSSFSMVLLESGLDPNAVYQGASLLTWVASNGKGSSKLARMLLEYGADPNASSEDPCPESVPLRTACDAGAYEVVKVLLEYEAKVNMRNPSCGSAFYRSCLNGHDHVVRLLLEERKVPETVADVCSTMLVHACTKGHGKVVEALLEFGANPRVINDQVFGLMAALESQKRLNIKTLLLSKDRPTK